MIGRDSSLVVRPEDDAFHPPASDDPSWIETMWFPFWVPEETLSGSLRVRLSPNLGAFEVTVAGWHGQSQGLFGDRISGELEGAPNLLDLRAAHGLHIECLEPLTSYRVRHDGPRSGLDLRFDAIMPPNPVPPEASPGMFAGHFEQPGHVTGEVYFGDRRLGVDCYAIRDRSWGPRQMPESLRLGNAYATADGFGFFVYVNPTADGTETITHGYLLQNGVEAAIVEGLRHTTLRDGLPAAVRIEARDATGRELAVRGECINAMASNAGNGVYAVLNLVQWEHATGSIWGENHDVWSESEWLAAGRAAL